MSLAVDVATKIMDAVDARFDEQIAVTADLVRIPSTRYHEAPAQDFMARLYREQELSVDRWQIRLDDIRHLPGYSPMQQDYEDAWNVVGAWRPTNPQGRSVDSERPHRRGAGRSARHVAASAVRTRGARRLVVRPRRRRT